MYDLQLSYLGVPIGMRLFENKIWVNWKSFHQKHLRGLNSFQNILMKDFRKI